MTPNHFNKSIVFTIIHHLSTAMFALQQCLVAPLRLAFPPSLHDIQVVCVCVHAHTYCPAMGDDFCLAPFICSLFGSSLMPVAVQGHRCCLEVLPLGIVHLNALWLFLDARSNNSVSCSKGGSSLTFSQRNQSLGTTYGPYDYITPPLPPLYQAIKQHNNSKQTRHVSGLPISPSPHFGVCSTRPHWWLVTWSVEL